MGAGPEALPFHHLPRRRDGGCQALSSSHQHHQRPALLHRHPGDGPAVTVGRGTVPTPGAQLDSLSNRGKRLFLNPKVHLPTSGLSKAVTALQCKPERAGRWQEPLVHIKKNQKPIVWCPLAPSGVGIGRAERLRVSEAIPSERPVKAANVVGYDICIYTCNARHGFALSIFPRSCFQTAPAPNVPVRETDAPHPAPCPLSGLGTGSRGGARSLRRAALSPPRPVPSLHATSPRSCLTRKLFRNTIASRNARLQPQSTTEPRSAPGGDPNSETLIGWEYSRLHPPLLPEPGQTARRCVCSQPGSAHAVYTAIFRRAVP